MSSITPNSSMMNLSSSLTTLRLHECRLQGTFDMNIFRLPCIQTLDLSYNPNLEGSLPKSNWSSSSLKFLSLQFTSFSGELPDSIGSLKSLERLYLSGSNFTGAIPTSIGNLTQIIHLDLSYNSFNGLLPLSIFDLPNLSVLDLHHNQLVGPLPNHGSIPSSMSRLVNLTTLDLSSNNLSIMLDLELFSNLNNLNFVNFSHNNLLVSINNNLTFTLPKLENLYMSSCNISEFPIFLRIASNLGSLDLSNNRIHSQTPKWLEVVGRNSLGFLDLSRNFLTNIDKIPWKNLNFVDLSNNLLQGTFPTLNALNLQYIFASNNNLTGEIPSLICNASSLKVLDLSHNNFSGTIPKCLVHSNVLLVLDLRKNSLNGTIPSTFSKRNKLRNINLNGNQLEGPLPQSLENCTNLEVLDLGNNKINDTFPYWLGSIQKLQVLVIRSNKFQSHIGNPKAKVPFPNLRILDISNNEFNGPLPIKYFKYLKSMMNVGEGEVGLKYMGDGYYHDSLSVMIKGSYIELERIQTIFTTIDFSNNSFIGEIPQIIGSLNSLKGLNFSHNNLTGYIPSSFGNLTNLEWLDLSFNKLDGEIPKKLADLPWLEVLKLSHNQLTGQIPLGKQFNTFDNDSYIDNLGLCGFPLTRTCNNHESKQPPPLTLQQEDNLESKNGFGWQAVSIGYGCGVIFGTLIGYVMFKIGKPKWIVRMVKLEQHILLRRLKNNARRSGGRK
nr:receptor-like protein Cf-9 homolog [Quercus suber]